MNCLDYLRFEKWQPADWLALSSSFRMFWQIFQSAEMADDCWLLPAASRKPGMSRPGSLFHRRSSMGKPFNPPFSLLMGQDLQPAAAIRSDFGRRPPAAKFSLL